MKNLLEIFVFVGVLSVALSASFSIINSAGKDCKEDDDGSYICSDVCEFEDLKVMPGTADSDNRKCIAVFCSEDFTVTVHTCHREENPECTYQHDYTKSFPDCCNAICQSIVQLSDDDEFNKIGISPSK